MKVIQTLIAIVGYCIFGFIIISYLAITGSICARYGGPKEIVGISFGLIGILLTLYFPVYLIRFIVRKVRAHWLVPGVGPSLFTLALYILVVFSGITTMWITNENLFIKERQEEAGWNLMDICRLQVKYFEKYNTYAGLAGEVNVFERIDWEPIFNTWYAYYCSDDVIPPNRSDFPPNRSDFPYPKLGPDWPYTLRPQTSPTGFTCLAIGDIDSDEFLDIWMVNKDREMLHLLDDVNNKILVDIYIESPVDERSKFQKIHDWLAGKGTYYLIMILILCVPILYWLDRRDEKRYKAALAAAKSKASKGD